MIYVATAASFSFSAVTATSPHQPPLAVILVVHTHCLSDYTYSLCELGVHHKVVHMLLGPRQLEFTGNDGNHERSTAGALWKVARKRDRKGKSISEKGKSMPM